MGESDKIKVVAGLCLDEHVLNDERRITALMALRPADALRPNMWEYAGGKLDPGEDPRAGLKREIFEEFGVDCEIPVDHAGLGVLGWCKIPFEAGVVEISLYPVRLLARPKPLAAQALRWVDPDWAIRHLPCVPSTYLLYPAVKETIRVYCGDGLPPMLRHAWGSNG